MGDFGRFVEHRSGRNGSVELEERMEKLGGNTPILAHALGCLGARVETVAPFGLPEPLSCFQPLLAHGELHSVGQPGLSIALEFDDGKLMLAMNREVNRLDYRALTALLPHDRLLALFSACDLLAFVNWSEMPGSTDLLAGLARDVLPRLPKPVPLLVDLSDCTRRSAADLRDYLDRLAALSAGIRKILSLNRNEADRVAEVLGLDPSASDAVNGRRIRDALSLEWVVVHERTHATLVSADGDETWRTNLRRPALQTGAGDNFNAGLCAGWLAGLGPRGSLALASRTSAYYVEHARSPGWKDVEEALAPLRPDAPIKEVRP